MQLSLHLALFAAAGNTLLVKKESGEWPMGSRRLFAIAILEAKDPSNELLQDMTLGAGAMAYTLLAVRAGGAQCPASRHAFAAQHGLMCQIPTMHPGSDGCAAGAATAMGVTHPWLTCTRAGARHGNSHKHPPPTCPL